MEHIISQQEVEANTYVKILEWMEGGIKRKNRQTVEYIILYLLLIHIRGQIRDDFKILRLVNGNK